jgi:tetratricopeptide (TPR) repeat protein
LLPDVDAAVEHLSQAKRLDPGSMTIRLVEINVRIQRARLALILDKTFSLAGTLSAQVDALSLREELIAMGRWSESGRLLMLASDVSAMLRDLEGAESVLKRAALEELKTPDGPVVLGEAALRVGASEMALEFTERAAESDAVKRIRAAANIDLGGPARAEGLETLEKLALSSSPERELAAAERLAACMGPVRAPWVEQVAKVLVSSPHAALVARLRAISTAATGDGAGAERLAADLPDDAASAEVRLRIAGMRGQLSTMREAAERFLDFAPDASGRLLAATALAKAGQLRRAGEITALIAHDPNSPPRIRADAFATLLQTLADRNQWGDADREWQAFQTFSNQELSGGDGRVSAWQVRIAHHRRDQTAQG